MLAPWVVAEVQRLHAEGRLSRRAIARRMGVSRGSVDAIVRGRRALGPEDHSRGEEEVEPGSGPLQRCGGCGGLVRAPCLVCRLRAVGRNWPDPAEGDRRSSASGTISRSSA